MLAELMDSLIWMNPVDKNDKRNIVSLSSSYLFHLYAD